MASNDRNAQYAELKAEFHTMREEMDALGIRASFKELLSFEMWRRYRAAKRNNIVGHARRDNTSAIDRAEKAAEAAAALAQPATALADPLMFGIPSA